MFNLKLKLKLNFDEDKTYVSFKLLDKSPIKGNVINPVSQISLDDAKELLEKKVNNGEFTIVNSVSFHNKVKIFKKIFFLF